MSAVKNLVFICGISRYTRNDNENMAINQKTLGELKEKLLNEKARLEKELNILGKPTGTPGDYETKINQIGTDWEENATETEEYVDNLGVEDNLEKHLQDVDAALAEMAAGKYGFCANCGQEIDLERLKVYPEARTCIKCK